MDFEYGFGRKIIPPSDPERELQEVMRLMRITRAGSAAGASYANKTIMKDPTIAEKARRGYQK